MTNVDLKLHEETFRRIATSAERAEIPAFWLVSGAMIETGNCYLNDHPAATNSTANSITAQNALFELIRWFAQTPQILSSFCVFAIAMSCRKRIAFSDGFDNLKFNASQPNGTNGNLTHYRPAMPIGKKKRIF